MAKPINKDKTLQEKLKQFFGLTKGTSQPPERMIPKVEEVVLNSEVLKDIGEDSHFSHRIKTIKELQEIIQTKHLHEGSVEAICHRTLDMLHPLQSMEVRHTILYFYCSLIRSQFSKLSIMRDYFFRMIKDNDIQEDLLPRIEMLKALTDNGKKIEYFEEDAGPFLLEWMPEVINGNKAQEFLPLLVNIIKCNAAFLDEDIIAGIVNHTCSLCNETSIEDEVQLCLQVLDAVICYSYPPSHIVPYVVNTLSRTVNVEKFCQVSWKLMRNLLGTCLGFYGIFTMCSILQDRNNHIDPALLRGTVFFISMSLWGPKQVTSLKNTTSSVLPSFLHVLDCNNDLVAYEVLLGLRRLLEYSSDELLVVTWDLVLDIIEKLLAHPQVLPNSPSPLRLSVSVQDLISLIERLQDEGVYKGSTNRLFEIIEKSPHRHEASVQRLIDYKTQFLHSSQQNWLNNVHQLMEKYFRNEKRSVIRAKALDVLSHVFSTNRYLYEDELINTIVLPFLSHLELDPDITIRAAAVQLLVKIIQDCSSKKCLDLLDIIEKVIQRAFDQFHLTGAKDVSDTVHVINEDEIMDVKSAIVGLINIFKKKLHLLPSSHAIHIYKMLVNHIQSHYNNYGEFEQSSVIRRVILEFLLKLRANSHKQLGITNNDNKPEFSAYLLCALKDPVPDLTNDDVSSPVLSPTSSNFPTISYLDLSESFQVIITCLKQEKDWTVLELVLQELPKLLQSKAAIVAGLSSVNALCTNLCAMVTDRHLCLPESLRNTPSRLTRTDFQSCVLPVLAALAAYHNEMGSRVQRMMINCLQSVLVTKCARNSITALIQCTLEMQETMCKLLPGVLLSLSKISATVSISVPVLEFLSVLIRLPQLYVNFVEDQYMSIFAIALPYTNPKFDQYTVALAHRVIAMWFLKCRIPFRRDFARFITKGLRANMFPPAEDNSSLFQNEDLNAERKRSGSLNSQSDTSDTQPPSESTQVLTTQLLETCMDLMARFTFGMCSNQPKRSVVADFLLENGQTSSWLVGNKIVTITTSGCGTKAFKNGLCEKCYALCKNVSDDESKNEYVPNANLGQSTRRRHHSAIHRSTTHSEVYSFSRTKDDLQLTRQLSEGRLPETLSSVSELKNSGVGMSNVSVKTSEYISKTTDIDDVSIDSKESQEKNTRRSLGNLCSCWCNGWAEIFIRRPTGNTSWMLRIQNRLFLPNCPPDLTLPDVASLLLPDKTRNELDMTAENNDLTTSHNKIGFQHLDSIPLDPLEDIAEQAASTASELDTDQSESSESHPNVSHPRSNSPLRRTNSSPEMKGDWNLSGNLNKQYSEISPSLSQSETSIKTPDLKEANETSVVSEIKKEKTIEVTATEQKPKTFVRKSPYKEEKCLTTVDSKLKEVPASPVKEEPRSRLHLDLSNVPGEAKSTSPPHSASPQLTGKKTKSPPLSPPSRTTGPRSPPPTNYYRDRGHTISVMSPVHGNKILQSSNKVTSSYREMYRSGLSPSFVFLQLYHSATFGTASEKPVLLPKTEVITRAINLIDHLVAYETHKIGVIYVGIGQANQESVILRNECGSVRYTEFLHGLGTVVQISEVDSRKIYLGGLDGDTDGKFAYIWHDDMIQVVFHVATMMPNKENDPAGNNKKLHIANDFVTIVYNESGEDYALGTIKSQLTYACIIICPEDFGNNVVTVKLKSEIKEFGHTESHIVSDESLPIFVRQLAIHANLISMMTVYKHRKLDPYFSTWLERLRRIKQLHIKAHQEMSSMEESYVESSGNTEHFQHHLEDFTDYV